MTNYAGLDVARARLGIQPLFEWDPNTAEEGDWQWFCESIWHWLQEQDAYEFVAFAEHIGWQNHNGYSIFAADNSERFVHSAIGFDCEYTVRFWADNDALLTATVYHHDSPTGEKRTIHRLRDYIAGIVNDMSMQKLQKWLTAWRRNVDNSIDTKILAKKRVRYTRTDFTELFVELYHAEWLTDWELLNIKRMVDNA